MEDQPRQETTARNHVSSAPLRMTSPAMQGSLFVIALVFSAARVICGIQLTKWNVPPECIIWSLLIGILVVQQFRWEVEEWRALDEKGETIDAEKGDN
jgi:hypothetical protein